MFFIIICSIYFVTDLPHLNMLQKLQKFDCIEALFRKISRIKVNNLL